MLCTFCHAGGNTILKALNRSMPPLFSNSIILSSAEESDPVSFTKSLNLLIFGINGDENLDCLALAQFRLPLIALISPLCANNLNG